MPTTRYRLLAAIGSLTMAVCSCGAPRPPADEIVVLIEQTIGDIDPRFATTSYGAKISRLICAPLVSLDNPRSDLQMELAESVTQENPVTYLVRLRDARFSNGRPVTSRDVRWTLENTIDAKTRSPFRASYSRISKIDVIDQRTVRIHLREPHAPFVTDLDIGIVQERTRVKQPLVGAGPFLLVSRNEDAIVLERNPHYFAGHVTPRRVVIRVIRDDNARLLALVGGSADLTQNTVPPPLVGAVARNPDLRVISEPSNSLTYVGLNLTEPTLERVLVRRAIAHAIDRERIIRTKFRGRARLATGMLSPDHWAYNGDVPTYRYDPERARQLLDEAGFKDPDGDGPHPRFRMVYKTSANRFRVALARVIAAQLSAVGIETEVRSYEFATLFDDIKRGNFQIVTLQVTEVGEPQYLSKFFHSQSIPTPERPDAGNNRWRYVNATLDKLLEQGRQAASRSERIRAYQQAQWILAADVPIVPLYHEDNVAVTRREVEGFQPIPNTRFARLWQTRKTATH